MKLKSVFFIFTLHFVFSCTSSSVDAPLPVVQAVVEAAVSQPPSSPPPTDPKLAACLTHPATQKFAECEPTCRDTDFSVALQRYGQSQSYQMDCEAFLSGDKAGSLARTALERLRRYDMVVARQIAFWPGSDVPLLLSVNGAQDVALASVLLRYMADQQELAGAQTQVRVVKEDDMYRALLRRMFKELSSRQASGFDALHRALCSHLQAKQEDVFGRVDMGDRLHYTRFPAFVWPYHDFVVAMDKPRKGRFIECDRIFYLLPK